MGVSQEEPSVIYEDNKQAIGLCLNPEHHARNKHLDIKVHYIREKVALKHAVVLYVNTTLNMADIFTKPLSIVCFLKLRKMMMGM